jgi:hypothetical protein
MMDSHEAVPGALERVRPRPPFRRERPGTLAGLVRPAGSLAGLVLLRVLEDPRARRSIARAARAAVNRIVDRRPARRAVTEAPGGAVLVRRVETAIVVYRRGETGRD